MQKYFFKRRFIKEITEQIWTETINADFAQVAYNDLVRLQDNDVQLLECYEKDLKDISNQEHANKEGKEAVKNLKNKIKNIEAKIDFREQTLEALTKGINDKRENVKMYKRKIEFVKNNG